MNEIIAKLEALYIEVRDLKPPYAEDRAYCDISEGYNCYREALIHMERAKGSLKKARQLLGPKED